MYPGSRVRVLAAVLAALLAIPLVPASRVAAAGDTPSSTTLAVDVTASGYPGAATLTATVSPADATGQVEFEVDGAAAQGVTIADATATLTLIELGGGDHSVVATYTGDATYAASIASPNPLLFTINKADQTTLAITGPTSATYDSTDQAISYTGGSGSGAVTFDEGSSTACSIVAGKLSVTAGTGTCTITATKSGDANYLPTSSAPFDVTIDKADQAITFEALANRTFEQAPFTVAATAGSGMPVSFASRTTAVCTSGGANGATISFVTVGSCTIRASQAGDADWNPATPVDHSFTISKGNQAIDFTSTSPAGAVVGGPTYSPTATATSGLAVTFTIAAGSAGVCTFGSGVVSFIGAGTCAVNANQGGNTNWNAASQVQQSFSVGGGTSTTVVASNHNPSVFGQAVTFTATVSGGGATPGGTVTFRDGATTIGSGSLDGSGTATYTTGALAVATHSITAVYGGDANYGTSTSPALSQVVGKASTTLGLASSDASSTYGQGVTFTATISVSAPGAGSASGTVQFRVDGADFGAPVAVAAGRASVATSALVAGSHEISAVYSGDGNLTGSADTLTGGQTVAKATLTVTADDTSREYGQDNPAFTASISGFENGETLPTSGVTGSPTCSATATAASPVSGSPYPITCSAGSLAAANYGFAFAAGDLAVLPATSTVTLASSANPAVPNQPASLTATVTGLVTSLPAAGGSIEFERWNGATWIHLDTQALVSGFSASTPVILPAAEGEYQYRARFTSPDGNYANGTGELVQSIGRSPVTVTITASRPTWETNVPLVFTATITPVATNATVPVTGAVDFTVDGGAIQSVPVANGAAALAAVKFGVAGAAHTVTAVYRADATGSLSYENGTASPLSGTVSTNVVNATGVGVSSASIYPYRDTWRDTVAIRGTRGEPLKVTITIYRPTGSRLLTKTITAGSGAYTYTWTGRYSSGTMLPAGRYRVVQTLTDSSSVPALTRTWASFVTLSTRRMAWRTATYYATPGPRHWQFAWAHQDWGSAISSSSSTSTSALVISAKKGDWAGVGYEFTVPSASTYKSVSLYVMGRYSGDVVPKIGLHDWRLSTAWGDGWQVPWPRTSVGTSSTSYYRQTQTDGSRFVRSRKVRAYIDTGGYFDASKSFLYSVTKVRLVVTYGVLQ